MEGVLEKELKCKKISNIYLDILCPLGIFTGVPVTLILLKEGTQCKVSWGHKEAMN